MDDSELVEEIVRGDAGAEGVEDVSEDELAEYVLFVFDDFVGGVEVVSGDFGAEGVAVVSGDRVEGGVE